jgi:hypothetical protein
MTYDSAPSSKDLLLQPKQVVVQFSANDLFMQAPPGVDEKQYIKEQLSLALAQEILKQGLCEFTQFKEPETYTDCYRARAFLLPTDTVRILRERDQFKV